MGQLSMESFSMSLRLISRFNERVNSSLHYREGDTIKHEQYHLK